MLCWRRMEREGVKDMCEKDLGKERKKGANAISAFLNLSLLQKSKTNSYMEGGWGRGFRSLSNSNIGSPSKRIRNFDDLVTFFGGSAGVVRKNVPSDDNVFST